MDLEFLRLYKFVFFEFERLHRAVLSEFLDNPQILIFTRAADIGRGGKGRKTLGNCVVVWFAV